MKDVNNLWPFMLNSSLSNGNLFNSFSYFDTMGYPFFKVANSVNKKKKAVRKVNRYYEMAMYNEGLKRSLEDPEVCDYIYKIMNDDYYLEPIFQKMFNLTDEEVKHHRQQLELKDKFGYFY